jgi:hypothetical protein
MPRARAVAVAPPSVGGCDAAAADRSERLPSRQGIRGTSTYPKAYHDPASIRGRGHSAQRKSMAKQKDATGRCTVRPQRAKDGTVDRPKVGRGGKGGDLADIYGLLYARVPFNTPTDVALAREFSDKELRVLMGMNKMLINDYDPKTGKYTEKTKQNKIRVLLPNIANLSHPEDLSPVAKAKRGARSAPAVESQDNDGVDGGASANTAVPLATLPTGGRQTAWPDCGLGVVEDVPGGVHGAHMSEPDSPIEDPSASSDGGEDAEWAHSLRAFAHPNAEWASQHPVFQAAGAKFDLQFESGLGTSPHKMVTPLSLPAGSYEYEVANASGYVCAAMAVHFSSSCREGRSPRSESAETMQQNVLQVGVEAYRRSVAGELDRSTSMDEVVGDDVLGQSLRIVDIRAFSRSLRYPSTLDTVISQLEHAPGSMATFLYGHGSFRDIDRTGSTLFIGYFGESTFVVLDPRTCNSETGFPSRSGNPAMLVLLSAAELHEYLLQLLRGEGAQDTTAVDWQASFLEVVPAETLSHGMEKVSAPSVGLGGDPWLPASSRASNNCARLPAPPVATPQADPISPGRKVHDALVDSAVNATSSEMEHLERSMKRSSLDDDSLEASMQRSSLDGLEDVLPSLGTDCPSLEQSVQEAIEQETAKQASMDAWQAQMNSRMLKSRQEHERRQRLRQHQHASHPSSSGRASVPPPEEIQSRKRRMSLSSHFGAAFRKRGGRAPRKGSAQCVHQGNEGAVAVTATDQSEQEISGTPRSAGLELMPRKMLQSGDTSHYSVVHQDDRPVSLQVSPTGVTVNDDGSKFFHLTTILSWRVRRSESGAPVGFKLVFTDGSEMIFVTEQGREISDVLMKHALGLANLMKSGMHVRGTTMVN